MLIRLVLLLIAACLVPTSARAIVIRPAITGSVGNAVVEWETADWFAVAGGPALGGELLIGSSRRLLFGVSYDHWDFAIDSHWDEATQSDINVCVRVGDATVSRVNFFVNLRAGYSYQVRTKKYPTSVTTFEPFEFTSHGFGAGAVGGPSIRIGPAELEITAGFRISRLGDAKPVDSDLAAIPGKSGVQAQLRIAIAVPFGD